MADKAVRTVLMHGRGIIIICSLLCGSALFAGGGYLPRVGPVELRFEPDDSPFPELPLPPLPVTENPQAPGLPEPSVESKPVADSTSGEPTAAETKVQPDVIPVVVVATNALPIQTDEAPATNTITPQMFLRFFTPASGSNLREAVVVPNVGFSPARPTPSSTATFLQPNK